MVRGGAGWAPGGRPRGPEHVPERKPGGAAAACRRPWWRAAERQWQHGIAAGFGELCRPRPTDGPRFGLLGHHTSSSTSSSRRPCVALRSCPLRPAALPDASLSRDGARARPPPASALSSLPLHCASSDSCRSDTSGSSPTVIHAAASKHASTEGSVAMAEASVVLPAPPGPRSETRCTTCGLKSAKSAPWGAAWRPCLWSSRLGGSSERGEPPRSRSRPPRRRDWRAPSLRLPLSTSCTTVAVWLSVSAALAALVTAAHISPVGSYASGSSGAAGGSAGLMEAEEERRSCEGTPPCSCRSEPDLSLNESRCLSHERCAFSSVACRTQY